MTIVDTVSTRKGKFIAELLKYIREHSHKMATEDVSLREVKKYHKALQTRTALQSIEVNETNCDYVDKQLTKIEKQFKFNIDEE